MSLGERFFALRKNLMFLDLTQDRTKQRFVNAIVFTLAFAVVANLVLVAVLRDPRFREGLPEVDTMDTYQSPSSRGTIASSISPAPQFRAKNFEGFGVPGVEVSSSLLEINVNIQGTPFSNVSCVDRVASLAWLRDRIFCDTRILGGVNTTVDGGIVSFDDMRVEYGPPGRYRFQFEAGSRSSEAEVTMTTDVSHLTLLTDPISDVNVGETFPTIRVQVFDFFGSPLAGRTVILFPYTADSVDTATQWVPDVSASKHALLENSVAVSDEDGIAVFDNTYIKAFSATYQYLEIMCDGAYVHLYPSVTVPVSVHSTVSAVTIEQSPAESVVEGEVLSTLPELKVVDADGNPIANKYAYAIMTVRAGRTVPPFFTSGTAISDKTDKMIVNPVSLPSDANGIIRFQDLRFSVPGTPGSYKMKFVVDGVATRQTRTITVFSSVAQVKLDWFPPEKRNVFTFFQSLPTVTALNANGEGVPGKTVSVDVVYAGSGESADSISLDIVPELTAADGTSTMQSMYLKAGILDQYRFVFYIDGLASKASSSMWLGLATASRRRELHERRYLGLYGTCGNGVVDDGEECDHGIDSDCSYVCTRLGSSTEESKMMHVYGYAEEQMLQGNDARTRQYYGYYGYYDYGSYGDYGSYDYYEPYYYEPYDYEPYTPTYDYDYDSYTPDYYEPYYYEPYTPPDSYEPYYYYDPSDYYQYDYEPYDYYGGGYDYYYDPTDYYVDDYYGYDDYYYDPYDFDPYNYDFDPSDYYDYYDYDFDPYGGYDFGSDDWYYWYYGDYNFYLGPAECGNWIVEDGECCDDPFWAGCTETCQCNYDYDYGSFYYDWSELYDYYGNYVGECGDGAVGPFEQCEPPGEGACTEYCTLEVSLSVCGNRRVEEPFETCDDGNDVNGDGCNEYCQNEDIRAVIAVCGDGVVEGDEQCDNGPSSSDGTDSECIYCFLPVDESLRANVVCGDGVVEQPFEQCDDGNTVDGDGCDRFCYTEDTRGCGDGKIQVSAPYFEECDDGNLRNGDGCSEFCYREEVSGQGLREADLVDDDEEEDVSNPEGLLSADDIDTYDANAAPPTFDDALVLTDEEVREILGRCNKIKVEKIPKVVTVRTAMQPALRVSVRDTEGKPWASKLLRVSVDATAGAPAKLVGTTTVLTDLSGVATFNGLLVDGGYSASISLVFSDTDGHCVGGRKAIEFKNPAFDMDLEVSSSGRRARTFSSVSPVDSTVFSGRRRQNVISSIDVDEGSTFDVGLQILDDEGGPVLNMQGEMFVVSGPKYLEEQGFLAAFADSILDKTLSDDVSDNTGRMTWSNVLVYPGTPGEFLVGTRVGGVLGPSFTLVVAGEVASLSIETEVGIDPETNRVSLGDFFPTKPVIRVRDAGGNNLSGYRVFVTAGVDRDVAWVANLHKPGASVTAEDGPNFLQLSRPSDSNGLAHFPLLGMVGAARNVDGYRLHFSFGGETSGIQVVSTVDLPVIERLTLTVVDPGSSALSAGSPMTDPPKVSVTDASGKQVDNFFAFAEVVPRDGTESTVALSEASRYATSVDGIASFDQLYVARGALGEFDMRFVLPGGSTTPSVTKELTDSTFSLVILEQPPDSVTVGEAFQVRVQATISSGSPLVGKTVTLELLQQAGEGVLDPSRVRNSTDSNGIAIFNTILTAGRPGTYTIRFVADGIRSPQSERMIVDNKVASVVITKQPAGKVYDNGLPKATVSGDTEADIASLEQPELSVTNAAGLGLSGRSVSVTFEEAGNAGVKFTSTVVTNKFGLYKFENLYFAQGSRGKYRMIFLVDGIASEPSEEIHLANSLEPDTDQLNNWEMLVFLTVIALVPLWFGTSMWVHDGFTGLSLFVASGFIGIYFYVYIDAFRGKIDVFSFTLRLLLLATLVIVLVMFLFVTYRWLSGNQSDYYGNRRDANYHTLVYRLLMSKRRTNAFALHDPNVGQAMIAFNEHEVKHNERKRIAAKQSKLDVFLDMFLPSRTSKYDEPPSRHMLYETKNDFYYSQRFIFAATMSAFFVLMAALLALILVFSVGYGIDRAGEEYWEAKTELQARGFDTNTLPDIARDMQSLVDQAAEAFGGDVSNLNVDDLDVDDDTKDLIVGLQNMAQRMNDASSVREQFAGVEETSMDYYNQVQTGFDYVDVLMTPDKLSEFKRVVHITGFASAGAAFCIVLYIWSMMIRRYRTVIMGLRTGSAFQHDKDDFDILSSTSYLGVQTSHSIFEYLLIFVLLWLILAIFVYDDTRNYIIKQAGPILLLLFSTSFIIKVVSTFVYKYVLTSKKYIIRRRFLFGIVDVFQSFLSIVSGLTSAIIRLALVFTAFICLFMRLDYPLLPHPWENNDPGFHTYFSAAIVDFYFNNPVVITAIHCFNKLPFRLTKAAEARGKAINVQLKMPSGANGEAAERMRLTDARYAPGGDTGDEQGDAVVADVSETPMHTMNRALVARNRWALWYTLINNPSLCEDRRRRPHVDGNKDYADAWPARKKQGGVADEDDSDAEEYDPVHAVRRQIAEREEAAKAAKAATKASKVGGSAADKYVEVGGDTATASGVDELETISDSETDGAAMPHLAQASSSPKADAELPGQTSQ